MEREKEKNMMAGIRERGEREEEKNRESSAMKQAYPITANMEVIILARRRHNTIYMI